MMISKLKKSFIVALLVFLGSTLDAGSRNKSLEFYFTPQYIDAKVLHFGEVATADIDDSLSFGFGVGYNFDPHFELGAYFSYADADYNLYYKNENGGDEVSRHRLYTSSINVVGTYHLLKGDFTPFVSAHLGYTYTNTGISNGEEYWNCWPWYPCYPYSGSYTDNSMNYGASLGLRYDVEEFNSYNWFVKAEVMKNRIDYDTTSNADFTVYQLSIGIFYK
jgi:outer membrane protein W